MLILAKNTKKECNNVKLIRPINYLLAMNIHGYGSISTLCNASTDANVTDIKN